MAFVSRKPLTKFSGIDVLYDPQDKGLEAELDVVLVHGLNGDHIGTWKYSAKGKSDVFWPRDLLPEKQPKTRVLSFGYNADIYGGGSVARIRDHAQKLVGSLIDERDSDCDQSRPIVFVAHSLGGLIVKEALREARQHSDLDTANGKHNQAIANATRGILLFSTPHHGGDKKKWLQIADGFAPLATQSNTSPLVEALKSKSIELDDLSQDFRHHAGRYAIISFFEQEVYPGTSAVIVEKNSALMNLPHEDQFPLGKSHLDMCRFASQNEFRPVLLRIQRATKGGPDARIAAASSVPGMANIIPEATQQPRSTTTSMLLEQNGELAERFLQLTLMQEPEMALPPSVKYRFQK